MALTLPLHFFDGVCRCCGIPRPCAPSSSEQFRLAHNLMSHSSLFDVIRWRRTSKPFKKVADSVLGRFTRIDVRMYNGLAEMRHMEEHQCSRDAHEWHPHANVMVVEMSASELGIAVDTKLHLEDVRALIQLLSTFRSHVQQLFIDSPIIELLVSQINRQQVDLLLSLLRRSRLCSGSSTGGGKTSNGLCGVGMGNSVGAGGGGMMGAIMNISRPLITDASPYRPFFSQLRKLTITSKSNQLEHLSRLLNYAVGVDFLYETRMIDLLCLKIVMGTSQQWTHKPHKRIFRHLTSFRQWTEADSLGERYFQQFSGGTKSKQKLVLPASVYS